MMFRGVRSDFQFSSHFFDGNSLCKQNNPRWDAAFCGVPSGVILSACIPYEGRQAYMS